MNVQEIKAKVPEADVYELHADGKYIIVVDPRYVPHHTMQALVNMMRDMQVAGGVVYVENPSKAIRMLEMRDEPKAPERFDMQDSEETRD